MGEKHNSAWRISACLAGLTLAALVLSLPSCGGSAGPGAPTGGAPATTAPPATTPPSTTLPAGGGPTLDARLSTRAGKEPLDVAFDLSRSRDGSGGTSLSYLADFEGDGLVVQPGARFTHTYKTDGVTVRDTQLCVEDAARRRACGIERVKSYVDVDITVKKNTGCQGTVDATAVLLLNGLQVSASSAVDKVEFEAFNAAGRSLGTRAGQKRDPKQWMSGTWNLNDTTKLRVKATVFSNGVRGDDVPEDTRPAC